MADTEIPQWVKDIPGVDSLTKFVEKITGYFDDAKKTVGFFDSDLVDDFIYGKVDHCDKEDVPKIGADGKQEKDAAGNLLYEMEPDGNGGTKRKQQDHRDKDGHRTGVVRKPGTGHDEFKDIVNPNVDWFQKIWLIVKAVGVFMKEKFEGLWHGIKDKWHDVRAHFDPKKVAAEDAEAAKNVLDGIDTEIGTTKTAAETSVTAALAIEQEQRASIEAVKARLDELEKTATSDNAKAVIAEAKKQVDEAKKRLEDAKDGAGNAKKEAEEAKTKLDDARKKQGQVNTDVASAEAAADKLEAAEKKKYDNELLGKKAKDAAAAEKTTADKKVEDDKAEAAKALEDAKTAVENAKKAVTDAAGAAQLAKDAPEAAKKVLADAEAALKTPAAPPAPPVVPPTPLAPDAAAEKAAAEKAAAEKAAAEKAAAEKAAAEKAAAEKAAAEKAAAEKAAAEKAAAEKIITLEGQIGENGAFNAAVEALKQSTSGAPDYQDKEKDVVNAIQKFLIDKHIAAPSGDEFLKGDNTAEKAEGYKIESDLMKPLTTPSAPHLPSDGPVPTGP